jgi:predicted DNA-binding transcriptional regulator AlpA
MVNNLNTERQAFSIQEFTFRNGISLATYHKLKSQGRAPREMVLGRAIRISIEAERDWRTAREQPDDKAGI